MIGIVSGAGPLAGVDVAKKIIEETIAERDQDHLPVITFSVPAEIPDRSSFLLGQTQENPGKAIGSLFLSLEGAGATVAAIACNSAHATPIFDLSREMLRERRSKLKVIHIIEETIGEITRSYPPGTSVGVLSTTGTRNLGLYKKGFEAKGYRTIEPNDEWQQRVQQAIYDPQTGIKAQSSPVHPQAVQEMERAMDYLIQQGAEILLLGCTEIPLAIDRKRYKDKTIIDPNRILARKLIEYYDPTKLKAL